MLKTLLVTFLLTHQGEIEKMETLELGSMDQCAIVQSRMADTFRSIRRPLETVKMECIEVPSDADAQKIALSAKMKEAVNFKAYEFMMPTVVGKFEEMGWKVDFQTRLETIRAKEDATYSHAVDALEAYLRKRAEMNAPLKHIDVCFTAAYQSVTVMEKGEIPLDLREPDICVDILPSARPNDIVFARQVKAEVFPHPFYGSK